MRRAGPSLGVRPPADVWLPARAMAVAASPDSPAASAATQQAVDRTPVGGETAEERKRRLRRNRDRRRRANPSVREEQSLAAWRALNPGVPDAQRRRRTRVTAIGEASSAAAAAAPPKRKAAAAAAAGVPAKRKAVEAAKKKKRRRRVAAADREDEGETTVASI